MTLLTQYQVREAFYCFRTPKRAALPAKQCALRIVELGQPEPSFLDTQSINQT